MSDEQRYVNQLFEKQPLPLPNAGNNDCWANALLQVILSCRPLMKFICYDAKPDQGGFIEGLRQLLREIRNRLTVADVAKETTGDQAAQSKICERYGPMKPFGRTLRQLLFPSDPTARSQEDATDAINRMLDICRECGLPPMIVLVSSQTYSLVEPLRQYNPADPAYRNKSWPVQPLSQALKQNKIDHASLLWIENVPWASRFVQSVAAKGFSREHAFSSLVQATLDVDKPNDDPRIVRLIDGRLVDAVRVHETNSLLNSPPAVFVALKRWVHVQPFLEAVAVAEHFGLYRGNGLHEQNPRNALRYKLMSFAVNTGGHYITLRRNPNGGWWVCNDSKIDLVTEETFIQQYMNCGYLYCFELEL